MHNYDTLAHALPQNLFTKEKCDVTDTQPDVLDLVVQPEIKEFLATTIPMIPKITNIMRITSKLYDLTEELLKDTEILEILEMDTIKTAEAVETVETAKTAGPIHHLVPEAIQDGVALVHEAQIRAESDSSKVGMIGLYRMLKDPTVQKNLRFMKAWLAIISERQKKELHQLNKAADGQ